MLRVLLLSFILIQSANAFLSIETNYREQAKVLKTFDIDSTFMTDLVFITMKEDVDRYRTKYFLKVLENSNRFIPVLRNMIEEAEIPDAFLYLAMAESNFAPNAYSSAKAVGIWQFMPNTAKRFGLEIDLYVDERRDPIKSTKAAIEYLKYLHDRFGKWYLAAIAYNCGEGRLGKAIERAGTDDLAFLLQNKGYIPKESRMYIRKIMMMEHLSNSTDFIVEHDAGHLMNRGSTYTFSKIEVKGGATLTNVADSVGMSYKELASYNPHLKYSFVPLEKETYHLYIPYGKQADFAQNFDPNKDNSHFYVHKIKKGDSLYSIGKKYGVSYKVIKDFNRLKSNLLSLNKKLIIPVLKSKSKHYTIRSGDTIGEISKKFNVTIDTIMRVNNKKNSTIMVGERIVIPHVY
ncbi:MAG: transglycosylase SLT domain-containing protein [Sulfurospirillum sp.]|nr:transglycosylase SLT domain-containing protein [Sulfurospirillum sp.]MBL0702750.1 transglycosylase SLT domain-containing protein [Sulfurospirillum sp.]